MTDKPSPYTMRRTWPNEPRAQNDFVVVCEGQDVGRMYETHGGGGGGPPRVWQWTVYRTGLAGREPTLDAAKARWRAAFERARQSGELQRGGGLGSARPAAESSQFRKERSTREPS